MKYVRIDGATAIVAVEGRYDLLKTQLVNNELDTAFQNGCTKVMVDFDKTTYIDSAVERDLVRVRRKVRPENFWGCNAKGDVLAALRAAKFDTWLKPMS